MWKFVLLHGMQSSSLLLLGTCVFVWASGQYKVLYRAIVKFATASDDEISFRALLLYEIAVGVYSFDCQIHFIHKPQWGTQSADGYIGYEKRQR